MICAHCLLAGRSVGATPAITCVQQIARCRVSSIASVTASVLDGAYGSWPRRPILFMLLMSCRVVALYVVPSRPVPENETRPASVLDSGPVTDALACMNC